MPQWTTQQNNAITARGRNILVSAAAGSGKTAVLVERVKQLITDKSNPVSIDKLLIVTFTNAAASEMKSRISKALNDCIRENPNDDYYRKQLSLLPGAKISTIDSFCTNLVREHFYELSINQDFSILDDSELQLLEDGVISDILDENFEKGDRDFISLIENFTTPNNDKPITEAVKRLLSFIYAQPFPYVWLEKAVEQYNPSIPFSKTVWYSYIINHIENLIELGISLVKENISLVDFGDEKVNQKFFDVLNDDLTEFTRFKNSLEISWNSAVNERDPVFSRFPSSKKADSSVTSKMKSNRDIYKKLLTADIKAFLSDDEESYKNDAIILYRQLRALAKLVKETNSRLTEEKKERNGFSFSDIEHFAINLLFKLDTDGNVIRTQLAKSLSEEFAEILVDEYQDTNEAQDLLFTYLSNGKNMFTVGDIKQSIYRFRLAMPHIFNNKKKSYADYNENNNEINSKIILDKNFRSRKGICSYVNFVFSNIMSEELGELNYDESEFLNYGADYDDSDIPSACINILDGVSGDTTDEKEAAFIAKTIINKVNSGEMIKDGDSYRKIRYSDFVILMRSLKNHIGNYEKVLTEYSIPVVCDNSTNLFENNEIRILLSMLRTVDNPTQDIPLLATLMSPFYSFTEDELAQIKLNSNGSGLYSSVFSSKSDKVRSFLDDQAELRRIAVTMSVSSFIRYLVEDRGMLAFINAMGNAKQRYQNILKFISFAQTFDNGSNVGLTAFIRYIDKIIESDRSVDSSTLNGAGENAVKIMTVHHSKGLEFPIVILAGADRQYNKSDLNDKLLLNSKFGLGIKCHNEELMYQYKSLPYTVIRDKNASELMSENLRVLYVAMTRAKEQFITFITCKNLESKLKRLSSMIINGKVNSYLAGKINYDSELLLLSLLTHKDAEKLREYIQIDIPVKTSDFTLDINVIDEIELNEINDVVDFVEPNCDTIKKISEKLEYKYSRKELEGISSKLTASTLDRMDSSFKYIASSKPAFLNKSGLTPAQRGTAMHTFMQFCSYENAEKSLENEIDRLYSMGYLTEEQASSLDREKLSEFFKSDFAKRMFASDKIYREVKISSFVKACDIYNTHFDDDILVQGIADCVFEENSQLILVDYKTDKVNGERELIERYRRQIDFYKKTLEKTFKMPVREAVLYSFHMGKVCYYK